MPRMSTNPLYRAVIQRLDELGKSANAASLEATGGKNRDLVSKLKTKNLFPSAAYAEGLARVLGWTTAELLAKGGNVGITVVPAPVSPKVPHVTFEPASLPTDVPVYGLAAASLAGSFAIDGVIECVRRPPALATARNLYALYIAGSSMEPRYRPGDLVFVSPDRPARPGDDVVVQTRDHDGAPTLAWIKTLVRATDAMVTVQQLNPEATIDFRRQTVVAVHRVLTVREMFGG